MTDVHIGPTTPYDGTPAPANAGPPGWRDRVRAFSSVRAAAIRRWFEEIANKYSPGALVLVAGGVAAGIERLITASIDAGCRDLPIDPLRFQVTFSASRFAGLLRGEGHCSATIARLFFADIAFALVYPVALIAIYAWAERWRTRKPDHADTTSYPPPDWQHDLLLLLPIVAGMADIFPEDVLLGAASMNPSAPWASVAVVLGSLGAVIKWVALVVFGWGLAAELLAGPRGIVFRMLRFSVLGAVLGSVPLLIASQGQDILERVVEGDSPYLAVTSAVIALVFVGAAVWYCGRKLIQMHFADVEAAGGSIDVVSGWFLFFAEFTPRVLGTGAIVVSAAALAAAGLAPMPFAGAVVAGLALVLLERMRHGDEDDAATRIRYRRRTTLAAGAVSLAILAGSALLLKGAPELRTLRVASGLCLASAWGFYYWVYYRRFIGGGKITYADRTHGALATDHADLWRTSALAWIGIALSLVVAIVFARFPVDVGRALGPVWILALAAANAVLIGSVLVRFGVRFRFPLVRIMLACAVVFSIWNDNHLIRTVPAQAVARPDFATFATRWDSASVAPGRSPIVLVAAAGGGLRAAYWSAAALATLSDTVPNFARDVFALSGVSGGSQGVATYASLMAASNGNASRLPCASRANARDDVDRNAGGYTRCVRRLMRDDYLSPVLAKMVGPDLIQRFLPVSVRGFDRATALELSWERSYADATKDSSMSRGFFSLARPSGAVLPLLALNTTHVETGRRYIASSVNLSGITNDAGDMANVLGPSRDLPLSTAVHNSARFPLVSPAGRLSDADTLGRVVDGGYFENSGLVTLQEIHRALAARYPSRPIIVLYLCNDPGSCAADLRLRTLDSADKTAPAIANEVMAPIRAILHTRDARASLARAQLRQAVGDSNFLQLNVCDAVPHLLPRNSADSATATVVERGRERVVSPPLGWLLSRLARDWMDASLSPTPMPGDGICRINNVRVFQRLQSVLRTGAN